MVPRPLTYLWYQIFVHKAIRDIAEIGPGSGFAGQSDESRQVLVVQLKRTQKAIIIRCSVSDFFIIYHQD